MKFKGVGKVLKARVNVSFSSICGMCFAAHTCVCMCSNDRVLILKALVNESIESELNAMLVSSI